MRRGLAVLAAIAAGLAVALGVLVWWGVATLRDFGAQFAGDPARRVHFIDETATGADLGEMAVLLHPQLTGGAPLLVRDTDALRANRMSAYVTDKRSPAEAVGTVVLAMMGGENLQPVVTVFDGRQARLSIFCNMAQCQGGNWVDPAFSHEIGDLAEAGLPVERRDETFYEREVYLAAHAAALADPDVYFADPGGTTPLPQGDLRHSYRLLLPSRLVPAEAVPADRTLAPEPAVQSALDVAGARVEHATLDVDLAPVLTGANGVALSGPHDGLRLDGSALLTPNLVVSVRPDGTESLEAAIEALSVDGWDAGEEARLIGAALAAKGLPECRPGCIVDASRAKRSASLSAFPAPSWRLLTWKVVTP